MPFYEVEHAVPLSTEQKDALAGAITASHSKIFQAPPIFVNVRFIDGSQSLTYVAGKSRITNNILGSIRPGGGRGPAQWNQMLLETAEAWKKIALANVPEAEHVADKNAVRIFLNATIVAAYEKGFIVPEAGKDKEWLLENLPALEKAANEGGDQELRELLKGLKP